MHAEPARAAPAAAPTGAAAAYAVRPAARHDLAAVEALLAAADLTANDVASQFAPGAFGAQYVVATAPDGALVGVAGIEVYEEAGARLGLLRSVAVHPAWRDRGIGGVLSRDRLAWARAHGLGALYLLTQTAVEYWRRFGFTETSRHDAPAALHASSEWSHACPASAVAMRMELGGGG